MPDPIPVPAHPVADSPALPGSDPVATETTTVGSAAPKAAAPAPAAAPASKSDAIVDGWFNEHVHNSEIARHTQAYNALVELLHHLKARLNKEL